MTWEIQLRIRRTRANHTECKRARNAPRAGRGVGAVVIMERERAHTECIRARENIRMYPNVPDDWSAK